MLFVVDDDDVAVDFPLASFDSDQVLFSLTTIVFVNSSNQDKAGTNSTKHLSTCKMRFYKGFN